MRIVIDVNLSPQWIEEFRAAGIDAVHWTSIGDCRAKDSEIVEWARQHGCIIFTHDLDFGAILALTRANGPSVIQVRAQDVLPSAMGSTVLHVLEAHRGALDKGALVSVNESAARVRILPMHERIVDQGEATDDATRRR